jgi:hypothetical protein
MIQPIVEGAGDVEAVPVLLRRIAGALGVAHVPLGRPIRKDRGLIMKHDEMEKAIELARRQTGCKAVMILFDADDLCTKTGAATLQTQAAELARQLPCRVVIANKEYEAWFLASLEDLSGKVTKSAAYPYDPDQKRGAKEEVERRLRIYYNEPADQPKFTAKLNLRRAYERSRSFRKLVKEYRDLLMALGFAPDCWPSKGPDEK